MRLTDTSEALGIAKNSVRVKLIAMRGSGQNLRLSLQLRRPFHEGPARDALPTEHDVDTGQYLLQPLRRESADLSREIGAIDGEEL